MLPIVTNPCQTILLLFAECYINICRHKLPDPTVSINCSSIVNGVWAKWTPWLTCTATCEFGTHLRSRECSNPSPMFGGEDCEGIDVNYRRCNVGTRCPSKQSKPLDTIIIQEEINFRLIFSSSHYCLCVFTHSIVFTK